MNNRKEAYVKYSVIKQIRLPEQMAKQIKAKSLEQNATESEIIRQSLTNYINRNMSDTEIIHASLAESNRKIRYMESKIELLALIIMQQTKYIMKILPNKQVHTDALVNSEYEKFIRDCTKILKTNHSGVLESMILDAYERNEEA
jgi:Ribbon-helix-helix protein, copG family.